MKETQRQIQKEKTRKKILEAAYKEFGEKGIMTSRTSDIAKAAGVSHGSVFSHFKTQEELITEVIEDFGRRICTRTHELAENKSGVREVLKAHLEGIKEFESFYTRLVIESRLLPESSRTTFISVQSSLSFHLSQALEKEMKEGDILEVPISLIFNTWIGLVNYYLSNSDLFAPRESVVERYGEALIDYFMKLISNKAWYHRR